MFRGLFPPVHLLVILGIVLIIFGPGKLPKLGNSIGRAMRGFKKALEEQEHISEDTKALKKSKTNSNMYGFGLGACSIARKIVHAHSFVNYVVVKETTR